MTVDSTSLSAWLGAHSRSLRRRIRLIMLLDTADYAMISPVSTGRLHAFAYLADVLSPVYHLLPTSGRIYKRAIGPYFPDLQWELDRLIGMALVNVSQLKTQVEKDEAFVDACFALKRDRAAQILHLAYQDAELLRLRDFFRELAAALGALPQAELDSTVLSDDTWEAAQPGTVIDYAEWRARNRSAAGAEQIEEVAAEVWGGRAIQLSAAAKINLYVRYMRRSAHG